MSDQPERCPLCKTNWKVKDQDGKQRPIGWCMDLWHTSAPPEPTLSEKINALPEWARQFIHDIETKWDPAGDIRTIAELRDTIRALTAAPASAPPAPTQKRLSAACEKAAQQIIADSEIRTVDGVADTIYREMRELLQPASPATQSAELYKAAREYAESHYANEWERSFVTILVANFAEGYDAELRAELDKLRADTKVLREWANQ